MSEMWGEGYEQELGMNECGKMYETWKARSKSKTPWVKTSKADVSEVIAPTTEAVAPVSEVHNSSLSTNKLVGQEKQPRLDQGKDYAKNKVRLALQKEHAENFKKRINALTTDNFNLIKESNKMKANQKELIQLSESYKQALVKYRTQLTEMALLNQNIVNVNNLLVNESLALSFEDKKQIIERFKKSASVNESDEIYKSVLKEYTTSKKTIQESIEEKVVVDAIAPSSSKVIQENLVQPEAQQMNEHVQKMIKMSNYNYVKK